MVALQQYELGQVCSRLSSGKGIPASEVNTEGKYPVWGGNGLRGYTNHANFEGECAIIGRQGAFCGNVRFFTGEAYMTEHAVVVCANENHDTRYLAYLLSTMNLGRLSGQSAQPGLSVKMLSKQTISLPNLETQRAAATTLHVLDDKIANNTAINNHLEQMAQAIFKSWFVDFEPFGGVMPEDWREVPLGDVVEMSTKSLNPLSCLDTVLEHYSIPAFDEMRLPVFEFASEIKSNKYIVDKSCFLISKLNPTTKRIWRPYCISSHAVCSTEFIVYRAKNPSHKDLYYSVVDSTAFTDFLLSHITGSTGSRQRAIPSETLSFLVALPPDEVIDDFCDKVAAVYAHFEQNHLENRRLRQIRDSLLPRLMSGELSVSGL